MSPGTYAYKWGPSEDVPGGLYRAILYIEDGTNIHCFGDVCYCPDPDNQNCDELCE